jgi:hypothetical protein
VQDDHERTPRASADANHSHSLAFFNDGAFASVASDTSLRRFKTLLAFQHPPSLRPGMRVDNAEVAGLKIGRQNLDAVRGSLTKRERTYRRPMFAAMVLGGIACPQPL